jgi:hypothetical protein
VRNWCNAARKRSRWSPYSATACSLSKPAQNRQPGRSYSIAAVARAFERQGFTVRGRITATLAQRRGQPGLIELENENLAPPDWQVASVLSLYVYPTSAMAARAAECRKGQPGFLRKENIEIWTRDAASPAVVKVARRALASLPD